MPNPQKVKPTLMPLRRFVVEITGDASESNQQKIQQAVRKYHNRLANGTVPRSIFRKIGKELYVHLEDFKRWTTTDLKLQP